MLALQTLLLSSLVKEAMKQRLLLSRSPKPRCVVLDRLLLKLEILILGPTYCLMPQDAYLGGEVETTLLTCSIPTPSQESRRALCQQVHNQVRDMMILSQNHWFEIKLACQIRSVLQSLITLHLCRQDPSRFCLLI